MTRKQIVFIIRLLVIILIAYALVLIPANGYYGHIGYGVTGIYLFTNFFILWLPEGYFENRFIFNCITLLDTFLIIAVIYTAGPADTDLYLVYFLILCLAGMGAQFRYLLISAVIFASLYGVFLYQKTCLSGEEALVCMLRLPFIIAAALFCGFIVSAALRERENRIREEKEHSWRLFESSDVFAYMVGLFGEYLSANPKLYESYGFADEVSMLGLKFSSFHGPEETAGFQSRVDEVFSQGKPAQYESFDSGLDQWLSHTLSPVFDQANDRVFAVGVVSKDITDRVRKEEELRDAYQKLRETRDQLIQKDKMAALGRLASGVAHEIRNPMEIISMGVDYLENIIPQDNASAGKSLEKIYSAIDRANAIIEDVLKFSRKTEFVIESINLCALTDEVLYFAGHSLQKAGVEVFKEYQGDSIKVAGSRNMLTQVLLNLVNNSIDAMEESEIKNLSIKIYSKKVTEVGYKTGYRRADYFKMNEEMAVVEISDSGRGMAEDVLMKIFEPFFTTKPAGEGTGLGLSLAHMIMDRMMGTIDVSSKLNSGTTFYVKLQPEAKIDMIKEAEYDEL